MSNKEITMPIGMVTTPAEPTLIHPVKRRRVWISRYKLVHAFQELMVLLLIALLSFAVYYVVGQYLIKSVKVIGTSMTPTLPEGSQYLLDRRAFDDRNPKSGEIVVIRDPGDHGLSIKRVVAVGGDSILFKNGSVFINGKKLDETYLPAHTLTFTYSQAKEQFITCNKDQYFVMGDNRLRSIDSRAYGPVSRKDILGLVKTN